MTPCEFQGFILTRRWRDTPAGVEIEYWLATDAGARKMVLTEQTSVAFVKAEHRAAVEAQLPSIPGLQLRELALKTFHQAPVIGVYARQHRLLGRLARALEPQSIALYEADRLACSTDTRSLRIPPEPEERLRDLWCALQGLNA